ncbi:copper resistance protein B [Brevundimonas goettingensis]|uniref:Copper resistance protein B n=1 Tax=Brevundimonas goettingensis TaxID=2774190 RepID=A0A975GWX3_9CAUL|nr:copper resistance protein B [Brevundimonas goettingensis]QTC93101.1 copper resistance protein B [Brevundimonas goettingensis]
MRAALLPMLLPLAVATPVLAQTADPHAGHDMSGMTMAPAQTPPAQTPPAQTPAKPTADPHAGHDMSGMSMPGMTMRPPEIPSSADDAGRPPRQPTPAAALSGPAHAADRYFDPTAMAAAREAMLAENGDVRTTGVVVDRLEAGLGDGDTTWLWDVQGWSGGDINRFWWKSEGEGGSELEEAEVQALYSRAVRPFWDLQAGVRQTFRPDLKDTTDLVLGVQGLAPHWFEIDAAAFLSTEGDLSARIEAEYDQRLTQKWILQPRAEVTLAASDAPDIEVGSGLSSLELGLRLRYEIRREFAPYAGVEWTRRFGETADLAGEGEDLRVVVGLRTWF